MRLLPDFAPVWCSNNSGLPSNMPPTRPSLERNSSMIFALKSAGDVDIVLLSAYGQGGLLNADSVYEQHDRAAHLGVGQHAPPAASQDVGPRAQDARRLGDRPRGGHRRRLKQPARVKDLLSRNQNRDKEAHVPAPDRLQLA